MNHFLARLICIESSSLNVLMLKVVNCLHNGGGDNLREANEILNQLKEHPEAWQRVDAILQFSQSQQTKFYGLQILEGVIKTRWKILPREQCNGIKDFIVELIIGVRYRQFYYEVPNIIQTRYLQ